MKNNYATHWRQATPRSSRLIGKWRSRFRYAALSVSAALDKNQEESYLRCIYCHYVFDDQKEDFDIIIKKLKNTGHFVDTATCVQMVQGSRKIDGRYFHLSFDDGFRNNFINAVPILKKNGIPAIFFVPSSLIDADWNEARNYCMETTHYRAVIEMLRWSDLDEMVSMGFEIGSHTRTHARFSAISNNSELMENEILGSRTELEANIRGLECKYISWPYGKITDADMESLEMVNRAGYQACFGAYRGSVKPGKTDIMKIPRHQFEVQWPVSHIMYFVRGNMEVKV